MYETIVEKAPIGLLTIDEDGTIEWANMVYADILGVPREELVGTDFADLVAAGYYEETVVEQYLETVRDLLSSTTDIDERNYLVRTHLPDGETLVHDVHTALLPLEDGEFQGTIHAFRDVTRQKEYERELKRQNERLEEFSSVVSHDLRNPLAIAQGNLEIALETGDHDALEKVGRAHDRMEALVEDLLSLAQEGRSVQATESIDVGTVARRAWESVETGEAVLEVLGDFDPVNADSTRIQQALENLFRNSIEHGSDDGCRDSSGLTVTVSPLADGTGFFVADDGPGISPDERERVFDHGFTTATDGTGFGLPIVETIVEAHGWSIEAVEADGARFEITTTEEPLH